MQPYLVTLMHTPPVSLDHIGTVIIRPLEIKLNPNESSSEKVEPYCKVKLGWHSGKSSVAKQDGDRTIWNDNIVLERRNEEKALKLKVKDMNRTILNDVIGNVEISLDKAEEKGLFKDWYSLEKNGQSVGQILVEVDYHIKPIIS